MNIEPTIAMKLRSSLVYETRDVQFDEQLLSHIRLHENRIVRRVLRRKPDWLKLVDNDGSTLLHHAAEFRNADMVQYLIDLGVDVNVQDRQGRTALMTIPSHKNTDGLTNDTIETLLVAHAYVHLRDNNGGTALQLLICGFQVADFVKLCVRNLIAHYSNDNDKLAKLFLECKDPLLNLLYAGYPMLTRALLKQGYPVNVTFNVDFHHGMTALHIAVRNNDLEHVKLLVECGADVNATNENGYTPLSEFHKTHKGSDEILNILKILLDRGALMAVPNRIVLVTFILTFGSRKEIQLLRQYNLNLRVKDEVNRTALHHLAFNDCTNIFDELQGMDFDVNARDVLGRTPLHYAVGNSSSVEFLLQNGANVNALDRSNRTPLHFAFSPDNDYNDLDMKFVCDVRVVELLLESGADPQVVTSHRTTVIQEYLDTEYKKEFVIIKPVLAHLAMLEARGVVIKNRIRKEIYRHGQLKKFFIFYAQKIKHMKEVKVYDVITLYDLLMGSDEKLAVYLRNKELVLKLVLISKKYIPNSNYYFDFLQRRVQKMLQMVQVKDRAAVIISKLMQLNYGASHIISVEIASYLNYNDLLTLVLL